MAHKPYRASVLASVLAGLLTVTACGDSGAAKSEPAGDPGTPASTSSGSASDPLSQLVTEAKAEGSLTLYTGLVEAAAAAQADAFTKKYGIKVNLVRLAGAQFETRVQAESAAGSINADILVTANPLFIKNEVAKGDTVSLKAAALPEFPGEFPEKFIRDDLGSAIVSILPVGIIYNTDLVKPDEVPKTWADLLDSRWKGKIGISDPKADLGYIAEYQTIEKKYSTFLQDFAKQGLKVYPAAAPSMEAVASGEIALSPVQLASNAAGVKAKGAHVAAIVPDYTTGLQFYVSVVAKAKHAAAARLFALYMLSKDGADILATAGNSLSPFDNVSLPKDYQVLDYSTAQQDQARVLGDLGLK